MAVIGAVHYYSAGLNTAAGANVLAGIATWTLGSRDTTTQVPLWVLGAFGALTGGLVIVTWAGPQSLLPGLAQILGLATIWFRTPKVVITTRLCIEPLWIWYNVLGGAAYGLAASTAMFIGGIYRLIKLRNEQT